MGDWYDRDHWNYYSENRPRRVPDGIKTKKDRGNIGETWWSRRWLRVLEALGMGSRLTRGRSYARQGQVISIEIKPGLVKARVQGSMREPYKIAIRLQPLSESEWEKVITAMATQAVFAAKLLAGEMPSNIEEAFSAARISLFPVSTADLQTECSCPDWANPCKHTAAVYYILAEQFDEDPFLLFKLRGRTKEEIIAALRKKRAETAPAIASSAATNALERAATQRSGDKEATTSIRLEDYIDTFWRAGAELDTFAVKPHAPDIDKAALKRLGASPLSIGQQNVSEIVARAYDLVSDAAEQKSKE